MEIVQDIKPDVLVDIKPDVLVDIKSNIALIEKAASTLESRFAARAIRQTALIRHSLTQEIIDSVVALLPGYSLDPALLTDSAISTTSETSNVLLYVGYLLLVFMHDTKSPQGPSLANRLVQIIQAQNKRSLDLIASRIYFYWARFYELSNSLPQIFPLVMAAYRTAVLRQDLNIQATLINVLVAYFINSSLIDQADKFISKITFPESASNTQHARFMYYIGRMKAVQLEYSSSHAYLQQAIRKVPVEGVTAGFLQSAYKISIIVQLLMGEIPERSIFRQPILRQALLPYLEITQAVRTGDLSKFQESLAKNNKQFKLDKNYTLILRLRHNVIKAGVRRISLAYSCISLKDICLKLQLDSEEDAEFIVAKAIRDGVIDATIDHEKGFMSTKEVVDIYSTNEPLQAFHQRISYCLDLHNESVKAMRFPQNAHRKELEKAQNDLLEQERQLAQDLIDEDMD